MIREYNVCQATAPIESITVNALESTVVSKNNTRQLTAFVERMITNTRHAVGDLDARQATAIFERRNANTRHAVGDLDARQLGTTGERMIADARHAVGNDQPLGSE
jgi:hypothetical protein